MFGNYRTLTFIGLVVILGFFVIRPQWTTIQTLKTGVAEYSEVLANLTSYNDQVQALLRRRDALTPLEMKRLDQFIATDGINTAQVVYNLEQAVLAQQLSLVALHPFEVQRGVGTPLAGSICSADFVTQDIELTVSGTYTAFKKFLTTLETTLEPYTVTYMKFSNEDGSTILSFTIRVRVSAITL